MTLKYETGIATLIQFTSLTVLNVINGIASSVSECRANTSDCIGDSLISLVYIIMIAFWFGFIWVLGYTAQERRSAKLAKILMGAEGLVAFISIFNARHYPDALGLIISSLDFGLAVWVIILAFRLSRARGGRITTANRGRRPSVK